MLDKRIVGISVALVVAATATACGGTSDAGAARDLTTVSVMMFPANSPSLPIVLAEKQGMFAKHGIKLKIINQPNGITGTQAMQATKADVSHMSVPTLAQGWQAGQKFPYFCGGIGTMQTTLIAKTGSDLPSMDEGASWQEVLKALDGKKIGIQTPVGSALQLLFAKALSEAGVKNVTYVNLGGTPTTVKAVLDKGSVDVAQVNPPGTQLLQSENYGKKLIYMPEGPAAYADYYGSGLIGRPEWLKQNPELAKGFCEAQTEALKYIGDPANRETAVKILSEDSGISKEAAGLVVKNVYKDFSTEIDESLIQKTLDEYANLGITKPEPHLRAEDLVVRP